MNLLRREALHHKDERDTGIEYYQNGLGWVVRKLTGGTGISITDGGSGGNLTIAATSGITVATTLLSAGFAIDATGNVTATVAHGLSVTPNIQDIQVSVVQVTAVQDWAFNLLKIDGVDGTNVAVRLNVSTASATAGATAKFAIWVVIGV